MKFRLPIPDNWQDFESLCHELWREIWSDPNAKKNGRSGQKQHGVDIFGRPRYSLKFEGIQCKDKNTLLGSSLSEKELIAEYAKAKKFIPEINNFCIATTAPRDATIQQVARVITESGRMPIHVWSWDDIQDEILNRPVLLRKFYTKPILDVIEEPHVINLAASAPMDQIAAFCGRPCYQRLLPPKFRIYLIQVIHELCDNAFRHGKASKVGLAVKGASIVISDNGTHFNPLLGLDAKKASPESHMGSYVFERFLRRFSKNLKCTYTFDAEGCSNYLTLDMEGFDERFGNDDSFEMVLTGDELLSREFAQQVINGTVIPAECSDILLTVTSSPVISSLFEAMLQLLGRLPVHGRLEISVPRGSDFMFVEAIFNDSRLIVTER